ncbi:unnamed protein product [Cunninghamella echinulata]
MAYQRQLRDWMHNSHVVLLIGHFLIRNRWCSRQDVQSVCLPIIPDYIRNQNKRKEESDYEFSTTLKWLMNWWNNYFTVTSQGLITRSYDEYQLNSPLTTTDENLLQSLKAHMEKINIQDSEVIKGPIEFVDYLAKKSGSCDVSTQLFTAILRTLGYETRLVASLQPIPYRIPTHNINNTKKDPSTSASSSKSISDKSTSTKINFPIRQSRSMKPIKNTKKSISVEYDYQNKKAKPPTCWNEIWNPHQQKWITIDPIRQYYNEPSKMEPALSDRHLQLSWVLAFEEPSIDEDLHNNNNIRQVVDVTKRYSTRLQKAMGLRERVLTKREKQGGWKLWSDILLASLHPVYSGHNQQQKRKRDELEQESFMNLHQHQRMPTSLKEFKNHPLYALECHLKKFEVIYPMDDASIVIGHIKGERIFPRSCVHELRTRETWMKKGRIISKNQLPIKQVQARAFTLEKKRLQEDAKLHGEVLLSDCYGYWQTEPYQPPPVIDGKITKNAYGRVDLFTPDMLPEGAVHIEIQGVGKIARELGVDFAEAVVDFEFTRGKSVPVINGIVVAKENETILLEAWNEHQQYEKKKAIAKKDKEEYLQKKRAMMEQIIDTRVEEEYGKKTEDDHNENNSAWDRFLRSRKDTTIQNNHRHQFRKDNDDDDNNFILEDSDNYIDEDEEDDACGGFLPEDE